MSWGVCPPLWGLTAAPNTLCGSCGPWGVSAPAQLREPCSVHPASPISEISDNSWHKNNYRSNPSSATHSIARFSVTKFWNIAPGASLFLHRTPENQAHLVCSPTSPGEAFSPRFVPGQLWKSTSELRLPHDFSLDSVLHFRSPVLDFPCNLSISALCEPAGVAPGVQANSFFFFFK